MEDLERVMGTHRFFEKLDAEHVRFLVGCTKNVRFKAGEYLTREGQSEDTLFLVRQGQVALELARPGGDAVVLETIGPGDVLGISLLTPRSAHLDCRAREAVLAFGIDNACLVRKMNEDPRLGYAIAMRLLDLTYQRLARLRLQAIDVYG
jgi:CRP-like cAMP-binding protein